MKIHEYNEMMAYLTRPATRQPAASGGRIGFFKGENVLSKTQIKKIKKLYLKGEGYPKIASQYGVGKTTIEGLILDLKAGKVPFEKITSEESKIRNEKFTQGLLSKDADPKGLKKWAESFDGETRPNLTAIAKQFGYKDKSATVTALNNAKRQDVLNLPQPKSKELIRKEKIASKNINYLNDDDFKKLSKEFSPDTYDKYVTGGDKEFADFLNKKGHKAYGNKIFTDENVSSRRARLKMPSTNVTTRGKIFDDNFILQEADRMKLTYDLEKEGIKKIRNRVYTARNQEKNLTQEQKEKLYEQRQTPAKTPKQHPYNIGKKPSPEKLFWRDLLTNAQRHQSFLKGRAQGLPESHIKFLNPDQVRPTGINETFNLKIIDTNVIDPKTGKPKVLTYDNFLQHIDENQKLYRTDSKTALLEYDKKRFIQENTDLYKKFGKIFGQQYPFHIHHTAGRGANAFNVQFAIGGENMEENRFRRLFNTEWKAAKNFGEQRAAVKKYLDKVPKNLEVRLKNTPYGVRETLVDMTKRVAPEMITELRTLLNSASKSQIMRIRNVLGCPKGTFSLGGRVGLANGTDLLTCPMQKLAADPEGTLNKVGKAVPETRSPILDVLKKAGAPLAKWGGRAFVAAGPAFVMMETMDAAEKFREGEPAGQIAADAVSNLLLPGVGASYELAQKRKMMKDIASPSELAAMEKEDKLRYAKMLQEDPLRETDYGSMIEENISTPAEQLDRFNLEEKTTAAYDYNKEQRKEQRQEVQDQFFKNIREKADDYLGGSYTDTNEISLDDIVKSYYNEGGRVGFAKGPKDPSKRLFIKGLAALSVLPIVGKYFKLAKSPTAAKAVETAMEKVSGMPDWFQPFVNKVLKEGKDVTKTEAIADRQIVKRVDIEDATVDVHYDVATNDVRVEVVGGKTALDEPLQMQYKAPEVLEESGKKTKAQFEASESVPEGRQVGPDDYDIDLGENTTEVLDDLLSETDYLEGYATGKIRTPAEIKKAKLRAKMREDAQRDPGSLLDDFDD